MSGPGGRIALDTSVAVPLLVRSHGAHREVAERLAGRPVVLAGHAATETYSVLTRLPGDARLHPTDAVTLLEARFGDALLLPVRIAKRLPRVMAEAGIAGGATYDALVALAARENDCALATRDARALGTYQAIGVSTIVV